MRVTHRVPDAVRRLFGAAPQSRDPLVAKLEMGPGSAAHHADKFTDRILFLDGFPNMQVLDPLRIGQNVKEIIECDLATEVSARNLYQEAATHCHSVKDYVSRDLFESLMKDEEHHIDFLETQLDVINRIGLELYTQKHVGGLESE